MKLATVALSVVVPLFISACASNQSSPASQPAPTQPTASAASAKAGVQKVKSRDGSVEGEISGRATPGSKFPKLLIGMQMDEVQELMGRAPDRFHTYETGKRWIPFYFGNDARRMQVLYKGQGCLTFNGGNVWGGAAGDLIAIEHDATGACYQS